MGNLRSVESALRHVGASPEIVSSPNELIKFEKIVLPGVGAFAAAVDNLRGQGLWDALKTLGAEEQVPILGICLGMQLLADRSLEGGETEGLGLISGDVVRLQSDDSRYKIPHIGFDTITIQNSAEGIFQKLPPTLDVYFVHSYHFRCLESANISATTRYGNEFAAAVQKGNIYGTQFHPEKSQNNGLRILKNFVELS